VKIGAFCDIFFIGQMVLPCCNTSAGDRRRRTDGGIRCNDLAL